MVYQTLVYKEKKFDEKLGREFGNIILFQSESYSDSDSAVTELRTYQLPDSPWFAYLRETENGEIVAEELIDWYWIEGLS